MRVTLLLLALFQLIIFLNLNAQDIHWSQINQLQSFQNPSTIGQFEEDIKFTFAAKDQWRSVTKPYQTYFISIDTKLRKIEWLSFGGNLFTDVTGDGSFRTNQLSLISKIDNEINSKIKISGGLDFGFINKNIDFSYFKFDNQYDGFKYNGSISTNETFTNSSFTNITLGLGVSTIYKIKSNQDFRFGISLYNLNKVKESFYQIEIKRPVRINCNFSFNYFYKKHLINSSINIQKQNSYQEILIGMFDNIKTNDLKIHHFHSGITYRYLDAFILHLGLSYLKTKLIISYDINISKLNIASNKRGSFELNIQYLFQKNPIHFPIKQTCIDYF